MKNKKTEDSGETSAAKSKENAAKDSGFSEKNSSGELLQPRWSVVSFDQCVAKNLTYEKAERKIIGLKKKGFSGLCIVTDEAAERISGKSQ